MPRPRPLPARLGPLALALPLTGALLASACSSLPTPPPSPTFDAPATPHGVGQTQAFLPGCRPVKYEHDQVRVGVTLQGSGHYCLVEDLRQRSVVNLPEGFRQQGNADHVIDFHPGPDIDLDLGGHVVSTEPFFNDTGVILEGLPSDMADMNGRWQRNGQRYFFPHDLTLRNGHIRSPGPQGVGVEFEFGNKQWKHVLGVYERAYARQDEDGAPMTRFIHANDKITWDRPWDYRPATRFTLDNLDVMAGGRGVILVGAGNVLRNSRVEVDADTAVYLYGPGAVVENNTFIIHMKAAQPTRLPAVLKLRDAAGAVIRNNRFIVAHETPDVFGVWRKAPAAAAAAAVKPEDQVPAIRLIQSPDVRIEGNQVEGTGRWLAWDEGSSVLPGGDLGAH